MSKIYLVERDDSVSHAIYDVCNGFVVVAKSPREARKLCMENAADEGESSWSNAEVIVLGEPVDIFKETKIILRDFNAG